VPSPSRSGAVERIVQEARSRWPGLSLPQQEQYLARIMSAGGMFRNIALNRITGHPCPHCGHSDVDRGATGLDECNQCGGLSREGMTLQEHAKRNESKE
jgi:predicted RNA-binding Zn-ribbon protein involved in translation (DUF1610 family)